MTSTRFVECEKCRRFFLYLAPGEQAKPRQASTHIQKKIPTPRKIFEFLNSYVVGQEHSKKVLSVATYNHYKRLSSNLPREEEGSSSGGVMEPMNIPPAVLDPSAYVKGLPLPRLPMILDEKEKGGERRDGEEGERKETEETPPVEERIRLEKSNILLLGPTGSGKTLLAQSLARCLDVPMVICDCTTLTQAGYVGDDIDSVISKLLHEANFDVNRAQRGIVFLDEVDKISCVPGFHHLRDVGGEGVQQGLLKILEGTIVQVPERSRKVKGEMVAVDTTNILFISSGAFNGLDKIIGRRKNEKVIGFNIPTSSHPTPQPSINTPLSGHPTQPSILGYPTTKQGRSETGQTDDHDDLSDDKRIDSLLRSVEARDLMSYGMIPEFVGRFPVIVSLNHLDVESLVNILSQPKNALIPQFVSLFKMDQVGLQFSPEALYAVAERAMQQKTGARGLRSIVEQLLLEPMFEVPGSDITRVLIEEDTARGYHPARYQHKTPKETDTNNSNSRSSDQQYPDRNSAGSDTTDRSEIKTSVL
jgi:ATP-dependent Clp protease ATP-binding subunit ClpX